jgi:hypothetical protein
MSSSFAAMITIVDRTIHSFIISSCNACTREVIMDVYETSLRR